MKVSKANSQGSSLDTVIPTDVRTKYDLKEGEEVEFLWNEELQCYLFIKKEQYSLYCDLSAMTDKQLYHMYIEGKLKLNSGLCGGYIRNRLKDYIQLKEYKEIEKKLESEKDGS